MHHALMIMLFNAWSIIRRIMRERQPRAFVARVSLAGRRRRAAAPAAIAATRDRSACAAPWPGPEGGTVTVAVVLRRPFLVAVRAEATPEILIPNNRRRSSIIRTEYRLPSRLVAPTLVESALSSRGQILIEVATAVH